MKTKRFAVTLPIELAKELAQFAEKQDSSASLVAQHSITKNSHKKPTDEEIEYIRGDTEVVQLSFSQTAYQLIELWSEQTQVSKSKLVTYSLQHTFTEGEV